MSSSRLIAGIRRNEALLRCPLTFFPLTFCSLGAAGTPVLRVGPDGSTHAISPTGIARFLADGDMSRANQEFQTYYDMLAKTKWLWRRVPFLRQRQRRNAEAQIKRVSGVSDLAAGARILEVCVGTGINAIMTRPPDCEFFGIDISMGMLSEAARRPDVDFLGHAQAEALPFASDTFDVVFVYLGGVNFFTDKHKAMTELHRVTKPGGVGTVVDIAPAQMEMWGKMPVVGGLVDARPSDCDPKALVATIEAEGVRSIDLDDFDEGQMWRIVFQKIMRSTPQQRRLMSSMQDTPSPIATARAINLQGLGLASLDGMEPSDALQVLNLQSNHLTSFYGLPTMPALKFLHMEANHITSFLGLSHQPLLEMVSLEGNPISSHVYFRVMALLACGERVNIVNHTVVTSDEREMAARLGGSSGIAAKCVSYGWVDFTPEPMSRASYDELLVRLKVTYTNHVLALDTARSVGTYMARGTSVVVPVPATPIPPDMMMTMGGGGGQKLTLHDLRRHQQPMEVAAAPPVTVMAPQPPPPVVVAPRSRGVTALKFALDELAIFTNFVMFAHGTDHLAVSVASTDGYSTPATLMSPAASCTISFDGTLDIVHLATQTTFLRINLATAVDIILDEVSFPPCVKIQPDASKKLIVCAVVGSDAAVARVRAFFKVIMSVKCTPLQLGQLYGE